MGVLVERGSGLVSAVIYGEGDLEACLARALKKQHLRIIHLKKHEEALSVLEKPAYIFFFAHNDIPLENLKTQFLEAQTTASDCGSKLILILDEVDAVYEEALTVKFDWPVTLVETRGKMDGPSGALTEIATGKLVRLAFSTHATQKQVLIGKLSTSAKRLSEPSKKLSIQDVFNKINGLKRKPVIKPKKILGRGVVLLSLTLIFLSLFLLILPSLRAVFNLYQAKNALTTGHFEEATVFATSAKTDLVSAKQVAKTFGLLTQNYYDAFLAGETVSDLIIRGGKVGPKIKEAVQSASLGKKTNLTLLSSQIHQELAPIQEDLGLLEAQMGSLVKMGFPLNKYYQEISPARAYLSKIDGLLEILPDVISQNGKKTYLLVFQNSAELRPTGGFIGSYGIINFEAGKLLNWKIEDIYSADGQLRGHVAPPDELLHFFNQTSWYMRDANWAPDFPLTAKRLIWFLEKETGLQADGVIAINLGAAQKLLTATGPLNLPDLSQTVSAGDFFQKAEYSSEINFFPGSTQKKDFLGAVAKAMLDKLTTDANKDYLAIGKALLSSLDEKEIMLYFPNTNNNWNGSIENYNCQNKNTNCLMIVDANLGLNKANYFIKRDVGVDSLIDKNGQVETTATVHYKNSSPTEVWPGGKYKNYVRFLIPFNSKVTGFDIGNSKKPVISSILTGDELAKVTKEQFFVYQTVENSQFSSFGTTVEVPIESEIMITFKYVLPNKLEFTSKMNYVFNFIKQPGNSTGSLDMVLGFPSFLTPLTPLVFDQKLIYNSDTSMDRHFEINFVNKL